MEFTLEMHSNDLYIFFVELFVCLFFVEHLKNLHFCDKIIKEFFKRGLTAVFKFAIISDRQDNTVLFLRDDNYEY